MVEFHSKYRLFGYLAVPVVRSRHVVCKNTVNYHFSPLLCPDTFFYDFKTAVQTLWVSY